ncbi:MAG TPA: type VI secretion system contractile sheath large subunit [Bryobacteraceae bacterium]|jgi:type VI secretion system protein ImpC
MATDPTKLSASAATVTQTVAPRSLLDTIVEEGRLGQSPEEQSKGKEWVKELVDQVLEGQIRVGKDTDETLGSRIKELDELISDQLNEVMHSPEFQKMEGSWRGLQYLVANSETGTMLKIKVLNISKKDILKDFGETNDWEAAKLFRKIYEDEYGMLGGQPYGCLIGDFEFTRHPQDIQILTNLSNIAAAAHAPFLSAASPALFNFESYTELAGPRDLAKIFDTEAYNAWKDFRKSDDSKYVGLCLPHVLMRLPYGKETAPVEEFDYEEKVDGRDHKKYLWGNAAYALGARITDAFAKHEWCAAIRGVEGGGLVEGLPSHTFQTDDGDVTVKCPTEIAITDRRENELSKLGFIPACYYKGTTNAVFMATQSANKPTQYLNADANANARLSSQLQYMFAVSRFAHFLKAMMRDKVGSFMSREQCQKFLNDWITNYILLDDFAGQDAKAKFPLREARIEVSEDPAKPGVYKAVAFLRPHFQLDELTVSLRLVARLPESKG